ncbi:hypothetical protein CMV_024947 [Castanea mollissima]|uniref:Uncharacterized protein n=1 Tax=Castanea mollissima TaxID=60419 RepID=A0A8J4QEE7_9ROSI|nr:hypothetical protein CMV_024947 [Castanea mollissima]
MVSIGIEHMFQQFHSMNQVIYVNTFLDRNLHLRATNVISYHCEVHHLGGLVLLCNKVENKGIMLEQISIEDLTTIKNSCPIPNWEGYSYVGNSSMNVKLETRATNIISYHCELHHLRGLCFCAIEGKIRISVSGKSFEYHVGANIKLIAC